MGSIGKVVIALCAILTAIVFLQPYRPVVVSGPSMSPTYEDGQLVFAVPLNRPPKRGDVVLVEHDGATIIKRVSMVPGDEYLEVHPKHVQSWSIVTNAAMKRLADKHIIASRTSTVPPGLMFITGDNSLNSLDSRSFGLVPISSIRGVIQPIA
jgi:signal peptidase I